MQNQLDSKRRVSSVPRGPPPAAAPMPGNPTSGDEGFGDFSFLPYSSEFPPNSNLNTRLNDDDEWGDFVETPLQFQPQNSFFLPPKTVIFDPLPALGNPIMEAPESQPNNPGIKWEKPKGAIPLSIFGDEEEENDSVDPSLSALDGFSSKPAVSVKTGLNFGTGVGLNDLIADLYGQTDQIRTENGENSDLVDGSGDFDEDGWEFKDAFSEFRGGDINSGKEQNSDIPIVGAAKASSTDVQIEVATEDRPRTKDSWAFKESSSEVRDTEIFPGGKEEQDVTNLFGAELRAPIPNNGIQVPTENGSGTKNSWGVTVIASGAQDTNIFSGQKEEQDVADPFGAEMRTPTSSSGIQVVSKNGSSPKLGDAIDNHDEISWEFKGTSFEAQDTDFFSRQKGERDVAHLFGGELKTTTFNNRVQVATENGSSAQVVHVIDNLDESFWEFKDASSEARDTNFFHGQKEEQVITDLFGGEVRISTSSNDIQGAEERLDGFHAASELPTSSNGKQNPVNLFETEDGFLSKPTTSVTKGFNFNSDTGLSDLLSNLYSQAEQTCAANSNKEPAENGFAFVQFAMNSDLVNDDDDLDENCWEFKDASTTATIGNGINAHDLSSGTAKNDLVSNLYNPTGQTSTANSILKPAENGIASAQFTINSKLANGGEGMDENCCKFKDVSSEIRSENSNSGPGIIDTYQSFSTELKQKYLAFYSRLKEESRFLAFFHLENLEETKNVAAVSGEEGKVMALNEEIQLAYVKLHGEEVDSGKVHPKEHSPRSIFYTEFLEVIKDPDFQALGLEYHLSKQISLVEEDLSLAVALYEHACSIIHIITLGSTVEQSIYVGVWSKMVSACAKELQLGAKIWMQSLQKNVHLQILSKPRGLQYFLALGEIYRVAEVLRASTKVYKPWILSCARNSMDIFTCLDECTNAWTTSGLKEALESFSDVEGVEYKERCRILLESIQSICDVDAVTLQNHVFHQDEPICRLSLLPLRRLQDMQGILWNVEHYFLKLVNLWANRISSDPPQLPQLHVS